jgi:hypothetical protein
MIDLNELEIEFTEVKVRNDEYEKRVARLIKLLLEFDEALCQREDDEQIEVAA